MSRLGGGLAAAGGLIAALVLGSAPAYAGNGSFQHCIDQAVNHNGEPPTCTKVNGVWVASWPDDAGGAGGGFGGFVVFLVVVGAIAGLALIVWRVSTAQRLAEQSGMDPSLATKMTLLSDEGLEATYLAANLRNQSPPGPAATTNSPSTTERLEELRRLLDRGLVTQVEYDERRKAIIDSV
jgi:hypothetical protein